MIFFQLLQIRQSLQASFEGCDIYTPRKPKGLASKALEEWRKHYPNSEETNKTIGYKLAKYDRGPDSIKLKISPSGRIVWSPQMLQKLQEARQTAQTITARSGKKQFFYHPAMFFLLLAVYTHLYLSLVFRSFFEQGLGKRILKILS